MAAITICSDFGAPKNKVWHCFHCFPIATHSSILAWRIPWTEETGGLQSIGSQRVGHDWANNTLLTKCFYLPHVLIMLTFHSALFHYILSFLLRLFYYIIYFTFEKYIYCIFLSKTSRKYERPSWNGWGPFSPFARVVNHLCCFQIPYILTLSPFIPNINLLTKK